MTRQGDSSFIQGAWLPQPLPSPEALDFYAYGAAPEPIREVARRRSVAAGRGRGLRHPSGAPVRGRVAQAVVRVNCASGTRRAGRMASPVSWCPHCWRGLRGGRRHGDPGRSPVGRGPAGLNDTVAPTASEPPLDCCIRIDHAGR